MSGATGDRGSAISSRTLVLLRHGRTAWNKEQRIQGHLDAELDETGHAQALAAAKDLAAVDPAVLWTSDLSRARITAGYLAEASGFETDRVRVDARLREFHLGEREGLFHHEYAAAHPDEYAVFRTGDFGVVPGAETTADVAGRILPALGELIAEVPAGLAGVAVSHGAALRVAVAGLLGWDAVAASTLGPLSNCGWCVLAVAPDTGVLRLVAYNRVAAVG